MRVFPLNFGDNMVIGDSFKSQKRYMQKDIKSILSVSLAAMDLPSSSKIDILIDLTLDVREDSGESDPTNFDDSIPPMEGIPSYAFFLAWRYFIKVLSPCFHGGPHPFDRRSCCFLEVHVFATAHLTKLVFGVCLGGLAKRAGPKRENNTCYGLEDNRPREGVCDWPRTVGI